MWKRLIELDKKVWLLLGIFLGVVVAAASAETLHYTDTAEFCSTCHPMNNAFDSFSDSTHAGIACNKCHAPTDSLVRKLIFKAKAGSHDVYMNTFKADEIPDVIHAKVATKEVVQENCKSCHESTVSNISHDAKEQCIDCHRSVPHGKAFFKTDAWNEKQDFDINGRTKQKSESTESKG